MSRIALLSIACATSLALAGGCKSSEPAPAKDSAPAGSGAPAATGSSGATGAPGAPGAGDAPKADDPNVAKALTELHEAMQKVNPPGAVVLGLHDYDGLLPDVSAAGLEAETQRLAAAIAMLEALDPAVMSERQWLEREVLLNASRDDHFTLVELDAPHRNPMFYMDALSLVPYISRDYAPIETRITGIIDIAEATPAYLQDAQTNLAESLPRPFVETALLQARGLVSFVENDVPAALEGAPPEKLEAAKKSLGRMAAALSDYVKFLEARLEKANDDYALGEAKLLAMVEATQGLKIDLARLRQVAQADLDRNLALLDEAAKKIDPEKSTAEVVAMVVADKPAADAILQVATDQSTEMRKFLVDQSIVSIPFPDEAVLRESPPFMRWNAAFLDSAGPFETKSLPSFYYISPPDPSWPEAEQRAYIPATHDLLFITIHEVWPGHFLHALHIKKHASDIVRAYMNYAMTEGWAHYTEEMMIDAGVSEDPKVRVGQLMNALLRNVRFMSAIGLHTGTMDVAASDAMFREKAFQDPGNAKQQAVRGTFDPMYLSYTLGKLMIVKLHEDWKAARKAAGEPYSLQVFHDQFLSYGAAPVPVIRRAMLGPDAGPAL